MKPLRWMLPIVALACAGIAVVGAVLNIRSDRAIRVTPNLIVNEPGIIDAGNSPTIVRNPSQPANLVVSYRVDRPRFSAAIRTTSDEGATWQQAELPLPAGADRAFAPDIAFTGGGVLHAVYSNLTGLGNTPDNLWLSTSNDGGRSFRPPVRIAGPLAFQPRIVTLGPSTVVVTWLQADAVGFLRFAGEPPVVVAARSTDGGQTFSEPVAVSDPGRERVGVPVPIIDGRGRIQVLYEDFKDDRRDFENLDGPAHEGTFSLVQTTSTDGGASFSPGREIETGIVPGRRFFAFLPDFPSFAAGPGDTLYVAWADARSGDDDVYLRRSDDAGRSWSKPARVNENPVGDRTFQYLPRLAVSPDDRVDILYLDRRDVSNQTYLATSSGGGRSFEAVMVSDQASDSRVGPVVREEFGTDFGTRLGLINSGRTAIAIWTDTRFGTDVTGRQDILGAAIQLPEELPLVARPAWVISLVILGVAALVVSRLGRRRHPPGPNGQEPDASATDPASLKVES